MLNKKIILSFVSGFLLAAFYFTGSAGEIYRELTPKKTAEERAKDVIWQSAGESEFWRETKYWLNKVGASF